MDELQLPEDLVAFFRDGRQLEYDYTACECDRITLHHLEDLRLAEFSVDSDQSPIEAEDPHKGDDGWYIVPGVSLVAENEHYDPDGILVWIPSQQVFGTWDSDHSDLLVYPGRTWSDIVADPLPYINGQWYPDKVDGEYLAPWPGYKFRSRK